ncbi:MAG TPA: class I SAM-dependent methyltransferase [Pyrinomonadaceae bacterium]
MDSLEKAGCSGEQAKELVIDVFQVIQNNLMEQVMLVTAETWPDFIAAQHAQDPIRILEVGVGTGEFSVRMLPLFIEKSAISFGLDFAENMIGCTRERLIYGMHLPKEAINLLQGDATQLPFSNSSMSLVVWGKFGLHLTGLAEWEIALEEVKRVLLPKGFFLLYEPLHENNLNYHEQRRTGDGALFRSVTDYDKALFDCKRVATIYRRFCWEIYSIALWQKL